MAFLPTMPNEEFKVFVYEQFSKIGKSFSSPQRLIIMNILCQGEHTVETIARYSKMSIANVSRHLQILKSANLVKVRRDGKFIFYSPADEETCTFFNSFQKFAIRQITEIKHALEEISAYPSRLEPVQWSELVNMMKEKNTIIIDVRPHEEYKSGHIPGAISIPLEELEQRIKEISKANKVVAYCRGRFCILADKAVEILIEKGYDAARAEDGLVDWKIAGFPVEYS